MSARYPRAAKINQILDVANVYAADLGAPALADDNAIVTSTNMKVGSYTIAAASSVDGLARNVTLKRTFSGAADTPGTVVITGLDVTGRAITETLTPSAIDATEVAGSMAFAEVTGVTGVGWVINAGNDTIIVGFGNKIGLPQAIRALPGVAAASQVFAALLGTALVAVTATWDVDELCKNTIDASAGTYDGSKRLIALIRR